MGRTLYLTEGKPIKVTTDGPSLLIETQGKAGQRVPLRMIERVVVVGKVLIDSSVIALLASQDIPVFFASSLGSKVAIAVSLNSSRLRYSHRQKIFLESSQNKERFMNILRAWRRNMQLHVLKKILNNPEKLQWYMVHGLREQDYRSLIEPFIKKAGGRFHLVNTVVKGLFMEMIIARLCRAGLDPDIGVVNRQKALGLALDICYMLEPEQHLQTLQMLRSKDLNHLVNPAGITPAGMKNIAHRFENKLPFMILITDRIIQSIIEAISELETKGYVF